MIARNKAFAASTALTFIIILLIAACDRVGRAPADLDITPTPTATLTPTPTPLPEQSSIEALGALEAQLEAIVAEVPDQIGAGAVEWRRDATRGFVEVPNLTNGVGKRWFITTQTGSQANVTYAIFESTEDATAHYERMRDVVRESILNTGRTNEDFPQPNRFGSGLYGSVSIMQVEETIFVEVFIELFSSTQGNPLVPLSQQALNILDRGLANAPAEDTGGGESEATDEEASTSGGGQELLDAILAAYPQQLTAQVEWTQDTAGPTFADTLGDSGGTIATLHFMRGRDLDLYVEVSVFPDADMAAAYYETQSNFSVLEGGAPNDRFPEPNKFNLNGRYGSTALIQLDELVIRLLVPVLTTNLSDPLPAVMQATLNTVAEVRGDAG
jgi:hypothetical protein